VAKIIVDSIQQMMNFGSEKSSGFSVQIRLHFPDSLLPSYYEIDSIRHNFNLAADSLRAHYKNAVSKIDGKTRRLNKSVDSLAKLNLPIRVDTGKVDSLNQLRRSTENEFTSRLQALKARTIGKLDALDLPPEFKEPLQELIQKVDALEFNSDIIKIPELKIPGYSLPKIDGIGDLSSKTAEIGNVASIPNVPKIETRVGDLGNITQQAQAYQEDIKNIAQGNLNDVEKLPEAIEQQAAKIDGIAELQKQSGVLNQYKTQLDPLKDPAKAKDKVVIMAKKAAADHFAGKQEQLKAAIEKISKYKQKYSSVASIKDLPRRPPNIMKGKPFVDRLVPGLYLQYQQKNSYLLDVNPYLGYKISGRFTAGLGWNQRYAYNKDSRMFISRSKIYGPRGYVDFKLGKGFIAHIEGESMNSFVPSTLVGNPDTGYRQWVWSFMTGIKKEYKIYKNLKGTALIQYNLFNRYYKAPYVDRLNSRVGFELSIKQKAKSRKRVVRSK
jgi:hypothetical protein